MRKKSSAAPARDYPRIPPEHRGVQVNHCKSPRRTSYGVPAEQKSVPGSNRYTLEGKRGISSCRCTSCGVEFPLKSNICIVEEAARLASYLLPPAPLCCPNKVCANYAGQVPAGTAGAYVSFGKTAIGNPRGSVQPLRRFQQSAAARAFSGVMESAAFSSQRRQPR